MSSFQYLSAQSHFARKYALTAPRKSRRERRPRAQSADRKIESILFFAAALLLAITSSFNVAVAAPTDAELQSMVDAMSVEEKLGQLNQVAGGRSKNLNSRIDDAMLDRVRKGEIGSLLHVAGAKELSALQKVAVEESVNNIPLLFAMDVVHGYKTIFPAPIGIAASFDPEIAKKAARVAAIEATSAGLNWTFAPMIDIARDPRWGRIVEGAGSDPYLGSVMAVAQVDGFQGTDLSSPSSILATSKHFGAYGAASGGRDYDSADMSERTLHEIYLPPFYAATKAGSGSFMTAFNDINGVPTTANKDLIEGLLREEWSFHGLIVSDWNAIAELINHGVAGSMTEAGALALEAGVDVDMTSQVYVSALADRVRSDSALADALDRSVLRVLKTKRRLGLFDDPYRAIDVAAETTSPSPAHREIAREVAQRSVVLLKNDRNTLPITNAPRRIAVIGDLAEDKLSQLASWRARGEAKDVVSFLEGIQSAFPKSNVQYVPIAPAPDSANVVRKAEQAARRADLVLLFLGEDFDLSGEARSRSSIELPDGQLALAQAVMATDTPVISIVSGGRPLALEEIVEGSQSVLVTWFLGVEAGPALAALLKGEAAPGGKLPISYPRRTGQIPKTYDHFNRGRPADPNLDADTARFIDLPITPLFPFGHGLSYSDFSFSDLSLSKKAVAPDDELLVKFTLTNTGDLFAEETPQLYIRDKLASMARPVKQLRGVQRIGLEPGQSAEIEFTLTTNQFAFFDTNGNWITESGAFEIMIGASSSDIRLINEISLTDSERFDAPAPAILTKSRVEFKEAAETSGTIGSLRAISPDFNDIVPLSAKLEILASGFQWSEGPVWVKSQDALFFNDVPNNRMFRWSEKDGIQLFMAPSGGGREFSVAMREPGANGMIVSPFDDSELVIADHGARAISSINLENHRRKSIVNQYDGLRFNSPNDIASMPNGDLFFTDPPYGLRGLNAAPEKEISENGVYFLQKGGEPRQVVKDLSFPNGVAISPDQKRLFVSNSDPNNPVVMKYVIAKDGAVSSPTVYFDATPFLEKGRGLPDGMAIASNGIAFITGPEGVYVFSNDGTLLGVIETGAAVSNCTLDATENYLYLTSSSQLIRLKINIG